MKKFLSKCLNQNGMSLMETVIAMGMMGALAVGTMRVLEMGQKGSRKNELRAVASQLTGQISDYMKSKYACGDNLTTALFGQTIQTSSEGMNYLEGDLPALVMIRRNENGQPVLDENGDEVQRVIIEESRLDSEGRQMARPDGLFVDDIKVVFENVLDDEEGSDWDLRGNGRIFVRMSYCPNGGVRCEPEKRRSLDKAIPLTEVLARYYDRNSNGEKLVTGDLKRALCSTGQDGILAEARAMVDEVKLEMCNLILTDAAANGNTSETECGKIISFENAQIKQYETGDYSLNLPGKVNLKECQLSGLVPGSLSVVLSGGGGGGGGSDVNDAGYGGKAGIFKQEDVPNAPVGGACAYRVGAGGAAGAKDGNWNSSHTNKRGGIGGTSRFECPSSGVLISAAGGSGGGFKEKNHGGHGENSPFYAYLRGQEGGGGRRGDNGAAHSGEDAEPGVLGGGGGGGGEATAMERRSYAADGGDGAVEIYYKRFIAKSDEYCGCPEGQIRSEDGASCVDMCPGYDQQFDPDTESCVCASNHVSVNGECVSCSSHYAIGSTLVNGACQCPSNSMYCNNGVGDPYCAHGGADQCYTGGL